MNANRFELKNSRRILSTRRYKILISFKAIQLSRHSWIKCGRSPIQRLFSLNWGFWCRIRGKVLLKIFLCEFIDWFSDFSAKIEANMCQTECSTFLPLAALLFMFTFFSGLAFSNIAIFPSFFFLVKTFLCWCWKCLKAKQEKFI